ncbi:anti-sigma factor [Streptomyces sp. NPDC093510]|uniref:anti-sigma factor family protein n=1 Tax=Streptomyces sp. NPDC093510 TaxID=3155199 RepID=UPI003417A8DE
MTTATDSAGHPEVAEISDLTEGLLSPSRTRDVRQHLDSCELCADVYASLEEIRGMLGTLPGPPRMPADVAGRIDAALAAEALLDSTAPEGPAPEDPSQDAIPEPVSVASAPSSSTSSPGAARVSRETTSTSASSGAGDRPAGHSRAATGPGRSSRPRRTRRRTTMLGAVFTAAAIGLGTLLIQTMGGDSGGTTGAPPDRRDTANSFSEGKLKGRVTDLLEKNAVNDTGGKSDASTPSFDIRNSPESPKMASPKRAVQVPDCIQRGIGDKTPLAAEEGSYEGKRAYLVVVPHDSDTTKVSAYVVDAACVGKSSPSAGKVLVTHVYPQS